MLLTVDVIGVFKGIYAMNNKYIFIVGGLIRSLKPLVCYQQVMMNVVINLAAQQPL